MILAHLVLVVADRDINSVGIYNVLHLPLRTAILTIAHGTAYFVAAAGVADAYSFADRRGQNTVRLHPQANKLLVSTSAFAAEHSSAFRKWRPLAHRLSWPSKQRSSFPKTKRP